MKKLAFPLLFLSFMLLMSYFKCELGATEEEKKSVESSFKITKIEPKEESGVYKIKVDIIDDYYPSQIKEYSVLTIEKLIDDNELEGFEKVEIEFHTNGSAKNRIVQYIARTEKLVNFKSSYLEVISPERNYKGVKIPEEEVK